jgi:hypothetical protein
MTSSNVVSPRQVHLSTLIKAKKAKQAGPPACLHHKKNLPHVAAGFSIGDREPSQCHLDSQERFFSV